MYNSIQRCPSNLKDVSVTVVPIETHEIVIF